MSRAPLRFQDEPRAGLRPRSASPSGGDTRAAPRPTEARSVGGAHPHRPLSEHERPEPGSRVCGDAVSISDMGDARRCARRGVGGGHSPGWAIQDQGQKNPGDPGRDSGKRRRVAGPFVDAGCLIEPCGQVPAFATGRGAEDRGLRSRFLAGAAGSPRGYPRVSGGASARVLRTRDGRDPRPRPYGEARPTQAPPSHARWDDPARARDLPGRTPCL
jgi:hypothetical protein